MNKKLLKIIKTVDIVLTAQANHSERRFNLLSPRPSSISGSGGF